MKGCIALVWTALCLCPTASAEDCGPLKMVAEVQLEPSTSGNAQFVPVEIAGVSKLLLLDTGSSATVITASTANALGLQIHRTSGSPNRVSKTELRADSYHQENRFYADTGSWSDQYVVTPLTLGTLANNSVRFAVAPEGVTYGDDPRIAGVLGTDILQFFDVSVDFSAHTLALIDQNRCEVNLVYWPAPAVAVMPFERQRSGLVLFQATLDGHPIKTVLDTGTGASTLYQTQAEGVYGLTVGSTDTPADPNPKGEPALWHHRFKTLTFEGVTVQNPEFAIVPNRVVKHFYNVPLGSLIPRPDSELAPDARLGMNVLKRLHVYIAYKERKLYITPSAPPKPAQ